MKKPLFDLILGTKTMRDLGIILDFKKQMITIDEIELPMQSIKEMPTSKRKAPSAEIKAHKEARDGHYKAMPTSRKKALKLTNSLANSKEPKSTEEATKRVVQILDANYKKADLQAVVKGCTHLSSEEQEMLLELLTNYE